jgi:hypothetical protein
VAGGGVEGEGGIDLEEAQDVGQEGGAFSVLVEPDANLVTGEGVEVALDLSGVEA